MKIKLVTFQSIEAFEFLKENGYLICEEKYINKAKVGHIYNWIINKMNSEVRNEMSSKYPIWCWVKYNNFICPPKRKGKKIEGFDVKITFLADEEDVFITDFRRYSFLLNNIYIPNNIKEKENFDQLLKEKNISKEDLLAYVRKDKCKKCRNDKEFIKICNLIEESFDKCITKDSNILQGCVWIIKKEQIQSIEILNDDNYMYGSINYIRKNGKRKNWIEEYYKMLK